MVSSIPRESGNAQARAATDHGLRTTDFKGSHLWAELHRRPADCTPPDDARWLAEFTKRVPCGQCRRHWREILNTHPPDTSTQENYFAWTVLAHNLINARLGKAQVTMVGAIERWDENANVNVKCNSCQ